MTELDAPPLVIGDYVVHDKLFKGPYDEPPVCKITKIILNNAAALLQTVRPHPQLGEPFGVMAFMNELRRPTIDEWHRDCMNELDVGDVVDLLPMPPIVGMHTGTRFVVDKLGTHYWCYLNREVFTAWLRDDENGRLYHWPAFATRIVAKKNTLHGPQAQAAPATGSVQDAFPHNPDCMKCHGKGYTEELAGNWPCPDCCPEDHKFVGKLKTEPKPRPYHRVNEAGEVEICMMYHGRNAVDAMSLDGIAWQQDYDKKEAARLCAEIEASIQMGLVTKGQVFLMAEQAELKLKAERKQLRIKKVKELHNPKEEAC